MKTLLPFIRAAVVALQRKTAWRQIINVTQVWRMFWTASLLFCRCAVFFLLLVASRSAFVRFFFFFLLNVFRFGTYFCYACEDANEERKTKHEAFFGALMWDERWMCVTGYEILPTSAKTKETSFPLKFIVWWCCFFFFFCFYGISCFSFLLLFFCTLSHLCLFMCSMREGISFFPCSLTYQVGGAYEEQEKTG